MAEMKDLSATDASNTARFPENQNPSTVNNGARALEGLLKRWKVDIDGSVSSAGTNTITLAAGSALTAYAAGDFFVFKAGGTNTGAATINVDSVGAKTIQKNLVALVAGDIQQNDIVAIYYDGTQFQMISPARTPVLTAGGIAGASVAIATASTRGSVEFATDAETITGSSTALALTPANLQAMTGSASRDGILELATTAETVTGTDTARAITPAGLHGALAGLTDATITASDTIIFADTGSSDALKEDTVQGILDLAGGGAWNIIGTAEASTTASLTVTGIDSTYDTYAIALSAMVPVTDNTTAWLRLGDSSGVDSGASDYAYSGVGEEADSTASDINSTGAAQIAITSADVHKGGVGGGYSGMFFLGEPGDAAMYSTIQGQGWNQRSASAGNFHTVAGMRIANIAHDRVQFLFASGDITSGRLTVWGLAHA